MTMTMDLRLKPMVKATGGSLKAHALRELGVWGVERGARAPGLGPTRAGGRGGAKTPQPSRTLSSLKPTPQHRVAL